jgi:hypothetical protein
MSVPTANPEPADAEPDHACGHHRRHRTRYQMTGVS